MKSILGALLRLSLLIGLTGCVSTAPTDKADADLRRAETEQLTPAGEGVSITNSPQTTAGCKFISKVRQVGTEEMQIGPFSRIPKANNNNLRNEAAKIGANLVYVKTLNDSYGGDAYLCPDPTILKQ